MFEQWLTCRILRGMFSDEMVVEVRSKEGQTAFFFVPKDRVMGAPEETGKVKVQTFRRGQNTWVVLPTENHETISVQDGDLAAL